MYHTKMICRESIRNALKCISLRVKLLIASNQYLIFYQTKRLETTLLAAWIQVPPTSAQINTEQVRTLQRTSCISLSLIILSAY